MYSQLLTFAFTALAFASPMDKRQAGLCSDTSTTALCCETDVLGVADLTCSARKSDLFDYVGEECISVTDVATQ